MWTLHIRRFYAFEKPSPHKPARAATPPVPPSPGPASGPVAAALERRDQLASGKMSFYAVSRTWPMAHKQEAIFVKGLKLAGMKGEN